MKYGLQFRDVFAAWQSILDGVWITLLLSAVAMVGGLLIGILCAAGRTYGPAWLRRIVGAYVEVIRNTPLLVQLFLIFFSLPSFGVRLDGLTAAMIALVINLGAYTTEIVRAGLVAIPQQICASAADLQPVSGDPGKGLAGLNLLLKLYTLIQRHLFASRSDTSFFSGIQHNYLTTYHPFR